MILVDFTVPSQSTDTQAHLLVYFLQGLNTAGRHLQKSLLRPFGTLRVLLVMVSYMHLPLLLVAAQTVQCCLRRNALCLMHSGAPDAKLALPAAQSDLLVHSCLQICQWYVLHVVYSVGSHIKVLTHQAHIYITMHDMQ